MPTTENLNAHENRCSTGIPGLDRIIRGLLPRNRLYVIEGEPGSGKTTMALQFLLEGIRCNEKSLYITFSETKDELNAVAESHGWDLSRLSIVDLTALGRPLDPETEVTLFHPFEIELNKITESLLTKIQELAPTRIVFDSVSEMRLLAESPLRYRKQILALKHALSGRKATVFFLDDLTSASHDVQVQSIAHGVFRLSRLHHEFGGERRRLRILKLRGVKFTGGHHDIDIHTGGITMHPRMISSEHSDHPASGVLASGLAPLDSLLGGGLDRGTSNLFIGPAGTGKSSLSLVYALAAVQQGEKAAIFCFDETVNNLLRRSQLIGLKVQEAQNAGLLRIQKVDPAELSPGAFANLIQDLVERDGVRMIIIDSLNGYVQAMPQEQYLTLQLHELLAYLHNQNVVTILTLAQQGMIGTMQTPVDLTYLADTVLLTRFFEASGSVKKAVSVIKKRTGSHETTIREFTIDNTGVRVGPILNQFQGILTGVPRLTGEPAEYMRDRIP